MHHRPPVTEGSSDATRRPQTLTQTGSSSLPSFQQEGTNSHEADKNNYYPSSPTTHGNDDLFNDIWEVLPSSPPSPSRPTKETRKSQKRRPRSPFHVPRQNPQEQVQQKLSTSFSDLENNDTTTSPSWMPLPQWLSSGNIGSKRSTNTIRSVRYSRDVMSNVRKLSPKQEETITTTPLLTHLLHCLNNRLPLYCNALSKGSTISSAADAARELESPPPMPSSSPQTKKGADHQDDDNDNKYFASLPFVLVDGKQKSSSVSFSEEATPIPRSLTSVSSPDDHTRSPALSVSSLQPRFRPRMRQRQRQTRLQHRRQRQKSKTNRKQSLSSNLAPASSTSSALLALSMAKSEWDRFTSPLILFAGAEALFVSLEHLPQQQQEKKQQQQRDSSTTTNADFSSALVSIYNKINQDLIIVGEILCDPFLVNAHPSSSAQQRPSTEDKDEGSSDDNESQHRNTGQSDNTSRESSPSPDMTAAESVSQILSVISKIVNARCELINIHTDIVSSQRLSVYNDDVIDEKEEERINEESNSVDNGEEEEKHSDGGGDRDQKKIFTPALSPSSSRLLSLSKRCDAVISSLLNIEEIKISSSKVGDTNDQKDSTSSENAVSCMVQNIIHETKALSAALAAMHYLERCSFFETVVNARKLKIQLGRLTPFHLNPPSVFQAWMRIMLTRTISCMSIIFDRIEAYSSFSSGFHANIVHCYDKNNNEEVVGDTEKPANADDNNASKKTNCDNIESAVLDFICEQQANSGPPLAVAAVLNVDHGSSPSFERGFMFPSGGEEKEEKEEEETEDSKVDGIRSWPAIYMRTTVRSAISFANQNSERSGTAVSPATMGRLQGNRPGTKLTQAIMKLTGELHLNQGQDEERQKAKNSSFRSSTVTLNSSTVDGVNLAANDDTRNANVSQVGACFDKNCGVDPKTKEKEYWPEHGNSEWPHSEWPNLVSVLTDDSRRRWLASAASADDEITHLGAFTYRESSQQGRFQRSGAFFNSLESDSKVIATDSVQNITKQGSLTSLFTAGKFPSVLSFVSLGGSGPLDPSQGQTVSHTTSRNSDERESTMHPVDKIPRRPSISILEGSPEPSLPSSYHAVRIAPKLWMVVIVKVEEEKWHRKRIRGHTEEEIRSFLNSMASKLSLEGALGITAVARARESKSQLEARSFDQNETLANLWRSGKWQDDEMHKFLNSMKNILGLEPNSPRLEPLKSPYISRTVSSTRRDDQTSHQSMRSYEHSNSGSTCRSSGDELSISAMIFFLGPELSEFLSASQV